MSFVIAVPDVFTSAASDLAGLGSTIGAANAAAAVSTTGLAVAAADEVSAGIAAVFGMYADEYQAVSAQVAAFHEQFVRALTNTGGSYAAAEAVNVQAFGQAVQQTALTAVNTPTQMLTGRPMIGDGANATTPGGAGAPGGLLTGNGGNGAPGAPGQAQPRRILGIIGRRRRRLREGGNGRRESERGKSQQCRSHYFGADPWSNNPVWLPCGTGSPK